MTTDYQEAVRRYKNMKVNGHERQRYHALILVHQGYSYREVGRILLVDEETIRRWVRPVSGARVGGDCGMMRSGEASTGNGS